MRVLHVLQMSLPAQSGYSIRTSYITTCQAKLGIDCVAVTSARQPGVTQAVEEVDGLRIRRTQPLSGPQPPLVRELRLMRALYRSVCLAIRQWDPDVVHAHSPVLVGLPALRAAHRFNKPLVYEVRDLWENASVDHGKFSERSLQYKLARGGETQVFQRAEVVVTICEAMRDHIAPRVAVGTPLRVVANGVTAETFTPAPPSAALRQKFGLAGKQLFGFLGSFEPWEGLPELIEAVPHVIKQLPDAHLVIVGGGHMDDKIRALVEQRGLEGHVTFTGRVPHSEVQRLLALPDLLVYPRTRTRVTELTTPIKPLEAMAMARPVLVSDVAALLELVRPGETGMAFRAGDVSDLSSKIVQILRDADLRARLGKNARAYVEAERDWATLIAGYQDVYRMAMERRGA